MNPETRNLVAAICLSMSVLIGYQLLFVEPNKATRNQNQIAEKNQVNNDTPNISIATNDQNNVLDNKNNQNIKSKPVPRLMLSSGEVQGSISLKGAKIDEIIFKNYKETLEEDSKLIDLLKKSNEKDPYFIQFGWIPGKNSNGLKVPNNSTLWKTSKNNLSPDNSITLSWDNGQGIKFYQDISIDNTFMFTVNQRIVNTSNRTISLHPFGLISRKGKPKTIDFFVLHEGPLGVFNGELSENSYDDLIDASNNSNFENKDIKVTTTDAGGWTGFTDKYWLTALIPNQNEKVNFRYKYFPKANVFQTDYYGENVSIKPNNEVAVMSRAFAGAKKLALLDDYEDRYNIKYFDKAIDFGWFYFLTKPFFYALSWANDYLGNFGLAILAITVIVKLLFFPLANKSYKSMAKMRILTPQIQKLRERVGDDRQKLNQEMMNLYKKEKVNPAAGCLPILVQIPVFFALYKVLFVSIEMRQTPFFGWIKDLSVQDPTSIFNLFGLLPYSTSILPDFLNIGIWPLLMGVTMFLQQRLNPTPPDPIQAKIFAWMPVAFTFLLATFPAGLVIYWTWNNLLSICQQWVIMNKMNKESK